MKSNFPPGQNICMKKYGFLEIDQALRRADVPEDPWTTKLCAVFKE